MDWVKLPRLIWGQKLGHEPLAPLVLKMIRASYAQKGGYPDFQKPSDIPGRHDQWWLALDNWETPRAVMFGKTKALGTKWTGLATDGTLTARAAIIMRAAEILNKPGNFIEVDNRLRDVCILKGILVFTDPRHVAQLLDGRPFSWMGDGSYARNINGEFKIKTCMGCVPALTESRVA